MPRILPTRSIIKMEAMTTASPIRELKILFLADSRAPLSPPDEIIDIAPEMKTKINQRPATMVKTPIIPEIKELKMLGASDADAPSSPSLPKPPNPLLGERGMSAAISFEIIDLEFWV
jgi:hypothetical protein